MMEKLQCRTLADVIRIASQADIRRCQRRRSVKTRVTAMTETPSQAPTMANAINVSMRDSLSRARPANQCILLRAI